MAYSGFTLHQTLKQFGLTFKSDVNLFADIAEITAEPGFLDRFRANVRLAVANSTEKARSEWIVAPVLAEARRMANEDFGLLSGTDFEEDAPQDASEICDFIITGSPHQLFVNTPILIVIETVNEDMKQGYSSCIAKMVAARDFNWQKGTEVFPFFGLVTTGEHWRFLTLDDLTLHIDYAEYSHEQVGKILGILLHLVGHSELSKENIPQ